jgi:predicted DNA-binding protein with PD1-like motif
MTYRFDGFNYVVRLEKGELMMQSLQKLVQDEQIAGAWISGLGAALWAELGYYELDTQEYTWKRLDETLEITGLHGNVAWLDDEPKLHIHGSFSDRDMRGFGGHIKELAVGGTCEVFLHTLQTDQKLERAHDKNIGLPLLRLHENS